MFIENINSIFFNYRSETCKLPITNACINIKMQLNIEALNSMRKTQSDVPRQMYSDYYVTLTISRDQNASSDDVAFTCTSNQNKVFIMIRSITRKNLFHFDCLNHLRNPFSRYFCYINLRSDYLDQKSEEIWCQKNMQ